MMKRILTQLICCVSLVFCSESLFAQTVVSLPLSKDAFVISSNPSANYGAHPNLLAYSSGSGLTYRSAIEVDLSSIPSDAIITSAVLHLYKSNTNIPDLVLERFTESWNETQINHINQPRVAAGSHVYPTVEANTDYRFEVTNHVINMMNGIYENNGWSLRINDERINGYKSFHSRNSSTINLRPYLEVIYTLPLRIDNASMVHASDKTSSNGSITPTLLGGSGNFSFNWIDGSSGSSIGTGSSISNLAYGWYGLHVSDNVTDEELYMAFIVGTEECNVMIDFQPGPEYVDDAMIYDLVKNGVDYGNNNYGNYSLLRAEKWTSGSWYDMKSLLKFNLWMDADLNVDQAELHLSGINHFPLSRPNHAEIVKILDPWIENAVTYNTAPSLGSSPVEQIPGTPQGNEDRVVDMTSFWNGWKLNNLQNYGVMFQLQSYINSYTRMRFYSSDHSDPTERPWIRFRVNKTSCELPMYANLKYKMDGFYHIMKEGKIRFVFDQEYDAEDLTFNIYNRYDELIKTQADFPPLSTTNGDNYLTIDVSDDTHCIGKSFFYLEVINSKKEKLYLRFFNDHHTLACPGYDDNSGDQ